MKSTTNTVTKHIPTIHCNNNSRIKAISNQPVMLNHERLRQIKPSQNLWVDAKSNILELAERNILEKKLVTTHRSKSTHNAKTTLIHKFENRSTSSKKDQGLKTNRRVCGRRTQIR